MAALAAEAAKLVAVEIAKKGLNQVWEFRGSLGGYVGTKYGRFAQWWKQSASNKQKAQLIDSLQKQIEALQKQTAENLLKNPTVTKEAAATFSSEAYKKLSEYLQVPNIRPTLMWAYKLGTSPLGLATAIASAMLYIARRSDVPFSPVLKSLLAKGPGSGIRENMRYIGRVMNYYAGADAELQGLIHDFIFKKFLGKTGFKSPSPVPTRVPSPQILAKSLDLKPKSPTPTPRLPTPTPRLPTPTPRLATPTPRMTTPERIEAIAKLRRSRLQRAVHKVRKVMFSRA